MAKKEAWLPDTNSVLVSKSFREINDGNSWKIEQIGQVAVSYELREFDMWCRRFNSIRNKPVRLYMNYLRCFTVCIWSFRIATMSQWNQVWLLLSILVSSMAEPISSDNPSPFRPIKHCSGNPSCVISFSLSIYISKNVPLPFLLVVVLLITFTIPPTDSRLLRFYHVYEKLELCIWGLCLCLSSRVTQKLLLRLT